MTMLDSGPSSCCSGVFSVCMVAAMPCFCRNNPRCSPATPAPTIPYLSCDPPKLSPNRRSCGQFFRIPCESMFLKLGGHIDDRLYLPAADCSRVRQSQRGDQPPHGTVLGEQVAMQAGNAAALGRAD